MSRPASRNITACTYLLERFRQVDWVKTLANRYWLRLDQQPGGVIEAHLENVSNPSVKALAMAAVFKHLGKPLVVICQDPQSALKYRFELRQCLPQEQVEIYPTEDFTPYDQSIFPVSSLKEQYRLLHRLHALQGGVTQYEPELPSTAKFPPGGGQGGISTPFILLLSPKNLLLKHLTIEEIDRHAIRLKIGEDISPDALVKQCLNLGYLRTGLIMDPGEFSSRGDIFDIYPVNGDPVRIEFFGESVESIRRIDVDNQRSIESLQEVVAIPRSGIILTPEYRQLLEQKALERFENQKKRLTAVEAEGLESTLNNQLQSLEQEFLPDGIDYYAPLVHTDCYKTVLDYLPQDAVAVFDDWQVLTNHLAGLSDRLERQYQEGIEKGRLLDLDFKYHVTDADALSQLQGSLPRRLFLDTLPLGADGMFRTGGLSAEHIFSMTLSAPEQFKANLREAAETFESYRRKGYQVFISTDHPQRVLDACREGDVPAIYWPDDGLSPDDASWQGQELIIAKSGFQEGFVLPDEKMIHFTDGELFGRRLKRLLMEKKTGAKREDIDVINSVQDLRPGDYVVHVKHGIGQFVELTRITIDGETREYLTVQYSGSDRLHVPVDQVNLLSRYRGSGEKPAKLSKMGGIEWGSVKRKVKKSIQNIAKDLMALYARRAKARGLIFEADSPWQVEMEEAFPYTETPDQWKAITDMKTDMESEKPMDRLICGDVGFGKTEVAIRGVFKCVLSGKQAAILAPTTILAQQHFNTITERFKPYPVRIGLLSRFRSPKEQKEVTQRLAAGECDVVIGTHRLLQKDVKFKDLGLLVIDEEQRFGVAHKERIKQMRHEVDVLTLSATPIPRTLYMSLSGVRDMSIINTPPVNRSPIQTYVGPYNPAQIRMALLQEVDRGGQAYFVHNRVQTIYAVAQQLKELIPEVRFTVAHGQMAGDDLENIMLDFAQQQFDVLICTTIIESGLDIPNVNTIIVDRADRFGLAQLYQIRGRVGRSNVQAYAYCYYDPERPLTEDGKDRLRAIREFTTLGSGYQIALRDLEIRGVGNVLGSEQHGHMVAVGFDLYCQMLEESIQELQGEAVPKKEPAIIDLNVTALIPDNWIGDRDVKLTEYKRLADIDTELALEIIQAEWKDRFGEIPAETQQLIRLVRLRIWATDLSIPLVRADEDYIRINVPYTLQEWMFLQNKLPPQMARKARWIPAVTSKQGSLPTLIIKHLGMDADDQVEFLTTLFQQLQKIVTIALTSSEGVSKR